MAMIYVNPKAKNLGIPKSYGEFFEKLNGIFLQDDLALKHLEDHVIDLVDNTLLVSKFLYYLNKSWEEELEQ